MNQLLVEMDGFDPALPSFDAATNRPDPGSALLRPADRSSGAGSSCGQDRGWLFEVHAKQVVLGPMQISR